jgi:hypothetical protein
MLLPRHRARPRAATARALAQNLRDRYQRRTRPVPAPVRQDEPDVLLDVGQLHVGKIELKVDELTARVALDARVLDLVQLSVGVDAELRGVDLDIEDIDAQALLKVRLDNLVAIVDRTMGLLDRNPLLRDLRLRPGKHD